MKKKSFLKSNIEKNKPHKDEKYYNMKFRHFIVLLLVLKFFEC